MPSLRLFSWLLVAVALFGYAVAGAFRTPPATSHLPVAAASFTAAAKPKYITQPIKDIQVGQWVLAQNPLGPEDADVEITDPSNWRKIVVTQTNAENDHIELELLRDLDWINFFQANVGATIDLDLEELGAVGPSQVLAVDPCPEVRSRPSKNHHLVTAKFRHVAPNVILVSLKGETAPIGVTANHPFFSADRNDFVEAANLRPGESLANPDGEPIYVAAVDPTVSTREVFNLEIAGEHVYYVTTSGVLVHNNCLTSQNARILRKNMGSNILSSQEAHHIVASTHHRAAGSRAILSRYRININSANNGAGLTKNLHHGKGLHSYAGIDKVYETLRAAERSGANYAERKANVIAKLREMAEQMKAGNFL